MYIYDAVLILYLRMAKSSDRMCLKDLRPALIGNNAGCSVEDSTGTPEGQCPMQFRPLLKGIAKNYPTSGMLGSRYADEEFNRLLSGQDRIIGVARREALADGFPALFEVVRSCEWQRIPLDFLPLLKALRAKARIPLRCAQVAGLQLPLVPCTAHASCNTAHHF